MIKKMRLLSLLFLVIFSTSEAGSSTSSSNSSSSNKSRYQSFPKESCRLSKLKAKAKLLEKNDFEYAETILDKIKNRAENDPSIRKLKTKCENNFKRLMGHPPFDKYRAGKNIKGLYINATHAKTEHQHFILSACPLTTNEARDYLETAVDQKTTVLVSLLQSFELKGGSNNFWKNKTLKKIKLRDGTTFVQEPSEILQQKSSGKRAPKIVETRLSYGPETCTHLHYDGWKDKNPAPSVELLAFLLDRICELSPDPTIPVGINCKGGVGRTGVLAVSLYLRREIDAQIASGVALDDISINIPETIYALRKMKKSMVSTPQQFAQIYRVLAHYYEQLKETG